MNSIQKLGEISSSAPQEFSYSSDRSALNSSLLAFGLLLAFEASAMLILLLVLPIVFWLRLTLLVAYGLLMSYLVVALLATTRTRHSLDTETLHLHFGRFKASIPRSAIASARRVREPLPLFASLSARYDATKKQTRLTFSEQGQVLLRLREPLALQPRRPSAMTTFVLFNVDKPDTLLTALGLANNAPSVLSVSTRAEPVSSSPRAVSKPTMEAPPAVLIEGLCRSFGAFQAVCDVHMALQPGVIYGFLGSNGAGKSTTIKMLVGLLRPTAGHVLVAGHDIWAEPLKAKAALGYVADHAVLSERLSGRRFLQFLAQMRGLPFVEAEQRIDELLTLLDLSAQAERLCGSYSYGMKRKLSLAGALLHQPRVLVLDEPLSGLDPRSARHLKDLFLTMAAQGTAILLSTHDLTTAEEVCHRVGIIHKGRIIAEGSASDLRQMARVTNLEAVFLSLTAEQDEEVLV